MEARDYSRQQTPMEWALFTGRYETSFLMERLMAQPCAEQFCNNFSLEWPMLEVGGQYVITSTRHRLIPCGTLRHCDTKCEAAV
jgi:hypothetical protein